MTEGSSVIEGVGDLAARIYRESFKDTVYSVVQFREPKVTFYRFQRRGRSYDDDDTPVEPLRSLRPRTALFTNVTDFVTEWGSHFDVFDEVHIAGVNTDNRLLGSTLALFEGGVPVILESSLCLSSDGEPLSPTALMVLASQLGEGRVRT
jgi:hypothetical protein